MDKTQAKMQEQLDQIDKLEKEMQTLKEDLAVYKEENIFVKV